MLSFLVEIDIGMRTDPFISVIVPVRNEALFIRPTLEPLLNQKYDQARFEGLYYCLYLSVRANAESGSQE